MPLQPIWLRIISTVQYARIREKKTRLIIVELSAFIVILVCLFSFFSPIFLIFTILDALVLY